MMDDVGIAVGFIKHAIEYQCDLVWVKNSFKWKMISVVINLFTAISVLRK
jgi:hypothetical protein